MPLSGDQVFLVVQIVSGGLAALSTVLNIILKLRQLSSGSQEKTGEKSRRSLSPLLIVLAVAIACFTAVTLISAGTKNNQGDDNPDPGLTILPSPAKPTATPTSTPAPLGPVPVILQTPEGDPLQECIIQGTCSYTTGVNGSYRGNNITIPNDKTLVISGLYVELEVVNIDGQPMNGIAENNRYMGFHGATPGGYTINQIYIANGKLILVDENRGEVKFCEEVYRSINSGWAHSNIFVLASWGPEYCDGNLDEFQIIEG